MTVTALWTLASRCSMVGTSTVTTRVVLVAMRTSAGALAPMRTDRLATRSAPVA
jgi:hypothetical protein